MVVGGSGRGPSLLLAEGLLGVVGGLVRRSWRCWSALVSGQLLAWRRVPLGMLTVRVVLVMVLLMSVLRALQVLDGVMHMVRVL